MNPNTPSSRGGFPGLPVTEHPRRGRRARVCIASFDFVGPVRNGGVGTAFTSLGEALAEAGHEVTFLYLSGQYCENGKLEDWISYYQGKRIRFVPMPEQTAPRLEAPFHMGKAYEAYVWLREQAFDVIHFSEWRAPGYYALLAKHQGLALEKTVLCVHTHGPTLWSRLSNSEYVTQVEDLELDDMERFSVRMADVTVSPSQYLFRWMEQQGWRLPRQSFVEQYVQPASARGGQTGGEAGVRRVKELVFFGRLEVRKGLVLFCEALDRLKEDPATRGLRITFLGKLTKVNGREAADYLKERTKQWPWKWKIISDKDQPGAMKYLEEPSVLAVMPSLVDNLPNTVLECLGARVPFLTSAIGGIPEMIAPEDFERTCFPLRPGPFAEQIRRALREGARAVKPAVEPEATRQAWLQWHEEVGAATGEGLAPVSIELAPAQSLVSVCMSHFNRPDYLSQALASLEAQDYPNVEVVLVDDCSTRPEAVAYIESLAGKFAARGWQLVRNEEEMFVGAARNLAARHARGEYLLFMDDDNCAKPQEISTLMRVASKTGADILSCFLDFFSGREAPRPGLVPNFRFLFLGEAAAASALSNFLGDTNSLIRRSVFLQLGGFHEERGVGHEDWELFADAVLKGYHLEVVPEALVWYRRNEAELSATRTNSLHSGHMRNIRPYLDAVPPALRNLVLFAQGQIMRMNETATMVEAGPNAQHTIRWRSLMEAGKVLMGLKQETVAVQLYVDAIQAAEASQHPIVILEALLEVGAGLARLDPDRSRQLLQMAAHLAEKIHSAPALEKAKQLLEALNRIAPAKRATAGATPAPEAKGPQKALARPKELAEGAGAASADPLVSIVIPTFNNLPLTQQCLEAVARTTAAPYEVIVVDNGSTDGTQDYLGQEEAAGRLRCIRNGENFGFARACNQGAQAARGELVLFLNNDTVPRAGWMEPLIRILSADGAAGAAGGKLIYPDGSIQHGGIIICHDEPAGDPLVAQLLYRGERADLEAANKARPLQALTAACLLVRKGAFDVVGGFDESYWNGYEDVDLCFKLRERKWKIIYEPASVVVHYESKSGPERFARAPQNILRLHQKWLGKVQPDITIKAGGGIVMGEDSLLGSGATERNSLPAVSVAATDGTGPKVSIVMLTLNNLAWTRRCVASIQRHTAAMDYELMVVDNGSTDGTPAYLREIQTEHRNVRVIANQSNRGFAAGNNQGLSLATGRTVLLLNNDTELAAGWLDRMLAVLAEHPETGLVGPMSNCISGPQLVQEASSMEAAQGPAFAQTWAEKMSGQSLEVTRLVGFCLLARREVIERIGGLDERFGSGNFEDDDFCLRALSLGYKARIARDVFVYHAGSQTFKSAGIDYRKSMMSNWALFKRKWSMAADAPIEKGYRTPCRLAGGEAVKVPLGGLEHDHQASAEGRWWQEGAQPRIAGGVRAARAPMELPAAARVGSLHEARELLRQKKHVDAWNAASEAIRRRPFHPEGYLLLAEIAKGGGDFSQARRCAEQARALAPSWKGARKLLKSIPGGTGSGAMAWPGGPENSPIPRLSVCLIARNEERFLSQCLKSVGGMAQQVIVVDTGSTDRTLEIAREHGAEVHAFEWVDDFGAARNAALEHATGDWILILDADEELSAEGHAALAAEMKVPGVMAYRLPIVDVGREEEGCSYVPRLFRNAPGLFFVGRVHEQVFSSLEVRRQEWGLENRLGKAGLRHHGYSADMIRERGKSERNLALLGKALEEMPEEPNLLMNYGLELVRGGELERGAEQYERAFRAMSALPAGQLIPELRETLLTQHATQLLKGKDFNRVVELLASPLAKAGGGLSASLHFAAGLAQMELRQYAEGAAHFRQCLAKRERAALSPINKDIRRSGPRHCLALCLKMAGQTEEATRAFGEALKEEPGARALRMDWARFQAEQGQPVEALQTLHQVIADKPDEAAAWLLGGEIALGRRELLEFAREWTGEAIKYFPEHEAILSQRVEALLASGEIESARSLLRGAGSGSGARALALRFICELLSDGDCPVPAGQEEMVSHEFLKWYRAVLGLGGADLIGAVHQRLERLRVELPSAGRILEQALAEVRDTAAMETACP